MKIEDFKRVKIEKGEVLFFQTKNVKDKTYIHEFLEQLGEQLGTTVYSVEDFKDMKIIKNPNFKNWDYKDKDFDDRFKNIKQ